MGKPIIEVRNLSKKYTLGTIGATTLKDEVTRLWGRIRGRSGPDDAGTGNDAANADFWALRDISFEVHAGEAVGIIGPNGAGKSTLLKILSRITQQTGGEITLRGRIASLLEVGTGFHPDLTGRENIFLNGAILGMTKVEIRSKFDEIVAFAEVAQFIDTPVKRYSSGMYVRLAFAVAAHLEPEILIVDEVLAVGDAAFQKKCLGKMGEVAELGRTVLFVSHNMQAITSLCSRAILINRGLVVESGDPRVVIGNYAKQLVSALAATREQTWDDIATAPGNDRIRLHRIVLTPEGNDPAAEIAMETPFRIEMEYWNLVADTKVLLNIVIYSIEGTEILEDWSAEDPEWRGRGLPCGLVKTVCRIPGSLLNEGTFRVRMVFFDSESIRLLYDRAEGVVFSVRDTGVRSVSWHGRFMGLVHPKLGWSTQSLGPGSISSAPIAVESLSKPT